MAAPQLHSIRIDLAGSRGLLGLRWAQGAFTMTNGRAASSSQCSHTALQLESCSPLLLWPPPAATSSLTHSLIHSVSTATSRYPTLPLPAVAP